MSGLLVASRTHKLSLEGLVRLDNSNEPPASFPNHHTVIMPMLSLRSIESRGCCRRNLRSAFLTLDGAMPALTSSEPASARTRSRVAPRFTHCGAQHGTRHSVVPNLTVFDSLWL